MAADVLLFDDDAFFAGLVRELLAAQGLRVLYYPNSDGALEHIRRERPQLVLSDIMMPGIDGISLCGLVKRDPELGVRTKVAIVSGKAFAEDRTRADSAGADLFFKKPLDVKEFSETINALLSGLPRSIAAAASTRSVRFWQDRDSPGAATLRVGKRFFVFDAGAGLRRALESGEARGMHEAWILISNFQTDHIGDLRALQQLVEDGCIVHLVGPDLTRLDGCAASLRPKRLIDGNSLPQVHEIREGHSILIGGVVLTAMSTLHPGPCLAFRLEGEDVSVVFAPAGELEPEWENSMNDYGEKLTAFVKGVGLLIHDARYRLEDLPEESGSGHSTPAAVIKLAIRAGVSRLALHRLDARYSPRDRRDIESSARETASLANGKLHVLISSDRTVAELQ